MCKFLPKIASIVLIIYTCNAVASVEEVYVSKVLDNDDKAIIQRDNGETYLIEKGVGCLSLWSFEGRKIIIQSPGIFLGVGSSIVLPNRNQECRIWDSKQMQ